MLAVDEHLSDLRDRLAVAFSPHTPARHKSQHLQLTQKVHVCNNEHGR